MATNEEVYQKLNEMNRAARESQLAPRGSDEQRRWSSVFNVCQAWLLTRRIPIHLSSAANEWRFGDSFGRL